MTTLTKSAPQCLCGRKLDSLPRSPTGRHCLTSRKPLQNGFGRKAPRGGKLVAASSASEVAEVDTDGRGPEATRNRVIGVLGGGQLGRMMGLAATNLGVPMRCLDPTINAPAGVVAKQHVGSFRDKDAIMDFARECDLVTVEIEHVDVDALEAVENELGVEVQPTPHTLRIIQDKFRQKEHFSANGIPVAKSHDVNDRQILEDLFSTLGPIMLKCKRLAYDGRGNYMINSAEEIDVAVEALGGYECDLYVEERVNFVKELAVMVARSRDGTEVSYPVVETIHTDSILYVTEAPANVSPEIIQRAKEVAEATVACLDGAGVFGVELFLLESGEVIVNEVAPRPHNSGHYTMNACVTSQFEQHVRAVLGWPLGDTSLNVGCAIMFNMLGKSDGEEGQRQAEAVIESAKAIPGASIHWYGKAGVSKNRKIGHVNFVGASRGDSRKRLRKLDPDAAEALVKTEALPAMSMAMEMEPQGPLVGIIMGSDSDLPTMRPAAETLEKFGVAAEVTVVSAHRTPERMMEYAKTAHKRGIRVIIAGAGGAAHLPGMVAALTPLPVIGVPAVPNGSHLDGLDALMSIVQMPRGVPVATVAIGNSTNAGLLALRILGTGNPVLMDAMLQYQDVMRQTVMEKVDKLDSQGWKNYQ
ncbi:hypothetical protein BSKO_03975 [Bryopsis sp. KO-2023]|nr:hypothetical protein BSKO_03975 [Bryopsis sp. KO-2023]